MITKNKWLKWSERSSKNKDAMRFLGVLCGVLSIWAIFILWYTGKI